MNFLKWLWKKIDQHETLAFLGLISLVSLYITWVTVYRINHFLTFWARDTGVVNQAMWNTLHGSWFHQTLMMGIHPANFLSIHGFFSLLFLLPFYALAPNGTTLFLLKNFLLIASSIPIYLIARNRLTQTWERLSVSALFLISPFLMSFCHIEVVAAFFAMGMIAASYYFHSKQKFMAFMASAIPAMLTTENFVFLYLAWGVFFLIERRPWKWVTGPMIAAIICFTIQLAVPQGFVSLNPGHARGKFEFYYGGWGNSSGSVLTGMLSHPLDVLAYLSEPGKWLNLFFYAFPFLPFLFLRPKFLVLAAPNIAIFFLMNVPGIGEVYGYTPSNSFHYLETCLFSFIAFIDFLGSIESIRAQRRRVELMVGLLILVFLGKFIWSGEVSDCFLSLSGLQNGAACLLFLGWCVCGVCGTLLVYCRQIPTRRFAASLLAGMVFLIIVFRLTSFSHNMLSVESYIFSTPVDKNRNRIARNVLEGIPPESWLTIPTKYSIVASSRPKVIIYNGNAPLSSLPIYSKSAPEYVFLDEQNYSSIFDAPFLNPKWDRSFYQSLLTDSRHWEMIFFFDGLYLLKRRFPEGTK